MSRKFWSELTNRLTPYVPGEQRHGETVVKLNTNENPYPPSPKVLEAIAQVNGHALRRYPDPESSELRHALAEYHSLDASEVFVGNGSDEILALAFMAFFTAKNSAESDAAGEAHRPPLQFPEWSYSFYPVYCELFKIEARVIPMRDDFGIDMGAFENNGGGVIFPNPNAPTSLAEPLNDVEALLKRLPDTLVLVDEAYVDFGAQSAVALVSRYPNLVVSQTFSKSRSLAGMRLGAAFANKNLIDALNRVKNSFNSYPCDAIAQSAGIASIADNDYYETALQRVITTREQTSVALKERGFRVLESATNFLFASPSNHDAAQLAAYLSDQGILVRHWSTKNLNEWLRISVGTDSEMQQLLQVIDSAELNHRAT